MYRADGGLLESRPGAGAATYSIGYGTIVSVPTFISFVCFYFATGIDGFLLIYDIRAVDV